MFHELKIILWSLEKMARKKSATRRNKQFKSVDPFRKGKSTKGLGQDIGLVSQQMVRVSGGHKGKQFVKPRKDSTMVANRLCKLQET